MNSTDFRIESIEKINYNGREVLLFSAFERGDNAYFFVGKYTAPVGTEEKDLWKFVAKILHGAD